jgi:hypothetical protein
LKNAQFRAYRGNGNGKKEAAKYALKNQNTLIAAAATRVFRFSTIVCPCSILEDGQVEDEFGRRL